MKIVLTGGPSAGKTVVADTILHQFRDRVAVVPECASILFKGGFPRGTTPSQITHQQKAIYHVQVELEAVIEEQNPGKLIVCDRGTLDGLAYWPEGHGDFFKQLKTTLHDEIKRYDFVFHLESAATSHFDRSNPVRTEGPQIAHELDHKIKAIWASHPKRIVIKDAHFFSEKIAHVLDVVREILMTQGD